MTDVGMEINMNKQAIRLTPAFKDYLWGGTKLKTSYNKKSDLDIVAESWELSTHKNGQSIVSGGEFDSLTLSEYIEKNGKECLGENALKFNYFPILIKFIDALDSLSVQVHPDDEYALRVEGEYGKTEMWYILECEEGASLYYGVNRPITRDELKERINNNTLLEVLNKVNVKKGDVFFIKSGTIHAIGAGIVICEIQQNSNTTYRVYDYDRRDKNGNTRELHIDKAVEVSTLTPSEPFEAADETLLAECEYFTVRRIKVNGEESVNITKECFASFIVTDGNGKMTINNQVITLDKGDSIFVPAQDAEVKFEGNCEIIWSRV